MTDTSPEFLDLQSALAGEYSLQREIGRGGMGIVYLARDVRLDRDVAIKVLPTHLAHSDEARERFLREARTAAGLSHPHIVPIHRVGETSGSVFFIMSFVDGETLGERLRTRGPLPADDAARVMREVAWALAYAHGRGIVHRDVKPDNILLEAGTGRALVTDFGIAYGGHDASPSGEAGIVAGTAQFMSPEQAAGLSLDGRSDIYALGVVGHLAVSGRLPFENSNVTALLVRQATEEAPSVARSAPGLPAALVAAIDRCLARDPDTRFANGEELAAALAPAPPRTQLPATLRAWLAARNPLAVPYLGWSGMFGTLTIANFIAWITNNRPEGPRDVVMLAIVSVAPILPVIGYHVNNGRRLFRAGHTLADLRTALRVAHQEHAESEAVARIDEKQEGQHRLLRTLSVASGTWLGTTFLLVASGVIHERNMSALWFATPLLLTLGFGALSNALGVQFIPDRVREWWRTGVRGKLWGGRIGDWLSRRLGAPERSRVTGPSAFRATEAALSVAASELFAALPAAYRDQLADLPAIVEELEARAAEARAEIAMLASVATSKPEDAEIIAARKRSVEARLAQSVASLEGVRLDLLRLHAGTNDLAPLTTLIESARVLGDDIARLADAQSEAEQSMRRR